MNELSFEDFFSAGTGAEIKEEKFVISSEGFDGYSDALLGNAEQALEDLNFLDSFEAVSRMNAETQIRMLKKIKNNYNSKTIGRENLGFSIESFCDTRIQSLEDAVAAPKTEGKTENKTQQKPKDLGKEHKGFFKTIWQGIKRVFKAIGDFFVGIGRSIADFFKGFKKVEKDVDPATVAEAVKEASTSADPEVKKAVASADGKNIIQAASKAMVVNDAIDNVSKFSGYASDFKKFSDRISAAADKMAESETESAALHKSVAEFLRRTAKVQMYYGKAFAKLTKAVRNTIALNKALSIYTDINKAHRGQDNTERKSKVFAGKFKTGDLYLTGGKFNPGISEQFKKLSGQLSQKIDALVKGDISKIDDKTVVGIRELSEQINKLVLGDKASYDVSTIDEAAYSITKLFGIKVAAVK